MNNFEASSLKLILLYFKCIFIILESGTALYIPRMLLLHVVQGRKAETMY